MSNPLCRAVLNSPSDSGDAIPEAPFLIRTYVDLLSRSHLCRMPRMPFDTVLIELLLQNDFRLPRIGHHRFPSTFSVISARFRALLLFETPEVRLILARFACCVTFEYRHLPPGHAINPDLYVHYHLTYLQSAVGRGQVRPALLPKSKRRR